MFQYKDHLGNVRLSYGFNVSFLNGGTTSVVVMEQNHYYPFGLKQMNYNVDYLTYQNIQGSIALYSPISTSGKLTYNYKFGGKEYQEELGLESYDFGAGNYGSAMGRWMNIDPLAEASRRFSPYVYALNNPVYFIDPDGMKADGLTTD